MFKKGALFFILIQKFVCRGEEGRNNYTGSDEMKLKRYILFIAYVLFSLLLALSSFSITLYSEESIGDIQSVREEYSVQVQMSAGSALSRIGSLKYISASESEELCESVGEKCEETLLMIAVAEHQESVIALYGLFAGELESILSLAQESELRGARESFSNRLFEAFCEYGEGEYSELRYAELKSEYRAGLNSISIAKSIDDIASFFGTALEKMARVESLLDETKREARRRLDEEYSRLESISGRYSKRSFETLGEIYRQGVREISELDSDARAEEAESICSRRIAMMREVRCAWVSCGEVTEVTSSLCEYPAGYDAIEGGYWAIARCEEGFLYDLKLSVYPKEKTREHTLAFRRARSGGEIAYVGEKGMSGKELSSLLSRYEIKAVFDIRLIRDGARYNDHSGMYEIRLLLPDTLRSERGLEVLYIGEDGKGVYYDARTEGTFLVFECSSFGTLMIIGERENRAFLVFALGGAILLMLVLFVLIKRFLGRRRKRKLSRRRKIEARGEVKETPANIEMRAKNYKPPRVIVPCAPTTRERAKGRKRAYINLDTISLNFPAGASVGIEELKEKGLVSERATYLKVLARGKLNKPLVIRAQAFSAEAVRMIGASGGAAILEQSAR